jgi:hypothetical protein
VNRLYDEKTFSWQFDIMTKQEVNGWLSISGGCLLVFAGQGLTIVNFGLTDSHGKRQTISSLQFDIKNFNGRFFGAKTVFRI